MKTFVADFETTKNKDDCRVWAYCYCDIEKIGSKVYGTNIDDFMAWCSNKRENFKVLFHRLEFDGQFIISWLFRNGFKHTTDQSERKSKTFNTLINSKGIYYQIEVIFERKGKSINKVTFQNSYNLIPLSVEKLAKAFKMPISKLDLDYEADREIGHELTEHEKEYISNDVEIVARAVKSFYDMGLNRMTIGSCALHDYKQMVTENRFRIFFPPSTKYDHDIRESYRGGYTYLEPELEGKTLGKGVVLDINSTHPFSMYDCELPHGTPLFFKGEYQEDSLYPLYIQMFKCQFELKKDHIPTVTMKFGSDFSTNEYLISSGGVEKTLYLTSVDLEMFKKHYDTFDTIEYIGGWKFKGVTGLFDEYIEKWMEVKSQSRKHEKWEWYEIAKRMLNALYGKLGTAPQVKSKIPYINKDGVVNYKDDTLKQIEGVYLPMATFITSYSRKRIIEAFQKLKDDYVSGKSKIRPVYTDTDSLHILSEDFSIPEWLDIDDTEIGKFKIEGHFKKAKFLRQKCYMEEFRPKGEEEFKKKITVAGMPESCYDQVNFKNFKVGATYHGKLAPERVPGGVVLGDIDFTIKEL